MEYKITNKELFITYIRTCMMFEMRFKGERVGMKPIHIPTATIEEKFFPFNRRTHLQELVAIGELKVYKDTTNIPKKINSKGLK